MTRQETLEVKLKPSYSTSSIGKLKLANVTYHDGILIAGYVPDLTDGKTRKGCVANYMHFMNLVKGEALYERIYKRIVRAPENSELEHLVKASGAASVESVIECLQRIKKNPFSFGYGSFGEKLDIACRDLAISQAKEVWHKDGFSKNFPAMYQLAVLEGSLGSEEEKTNAESARAKILSKVQVMYENELRWMIGETKSRIDDFSREVRLNVDLFGGNMVKARRFFLSEAFRGDRHVPSSFEESDRVVIVNREVSDILHRKVPGVQVPELDSFDCKGNAKFRIIYSPNAPPFGEMEEISNLSKLFD
jgi:hypothetical protein